MSDNHDHDHDVHEDEHAANLDIADGATLIDTYAATHSNLPIYTLAQMADDIDNYSTWSADTVTVSFPVEESTDYIGNGREGTLEGLTPAQIESAIDVVALFGDLIDLEFVMTGDDVDAEIRFHNSTLSGTAGGSPAGTGISGDIWIYNYDELNATGYNVDPGTYQYHLLIHELGHVMGLSHTSFVSGSNYEERANYLQNNAAYSAMSYLTAGSAGLAWDTGYSSTPMLADVAALQSMYGANMTTRTGDTVYGFNSTADRGAFDFDMLLDTFGEIGAITIWDAGGTDTLDMSGFTADAYIDLNDGTHSSVGGYDMNVAIAENAIIENAIGGVGSDRIVGNEVDNVLVGGWGADTLTGDAGHDTLIGDIAIAAAAPDTTHATAVLDGSDRVDFSVDGTDLDQMTVEMLISFDPSDTSTQWFSELPGSMYFVYDPANHGLWFRSGGQWTHTGVNTATAADGDLHRITVTYDGENGAAQIFFDGVLVRTVNPDNVPLMDLTIDENIGLNHNGEIADIRIFNDIRTADEIANGALVSLPADTEGLVANVVFDGGEAVDLVADTPVVLSAGATFGTVTLTNDDDVLNGGAGDDTLVGGHGADDMTGGTGNDHFVIGTNTGDDIIRDFEIGADAATGDKIDVSGAGVTFADITFTPSADGLLVTIGASTVLLENVTETTLSATDFIGLGSPAVMSDLGFETDYGTALSLNATELLANDGADLTITSVTGATLADGLITFAPDAGFDGMATFEYTATDATGASSTATVQVSVGNTTTVSSATQTVVTTYDNGGRSHLFVSDDAGIHAWANYEVHYNFDGDIDGRTVSYDDGRQMETTISNGAITHSYLDDRDDRFTWDTIDRIYIGGEVRSMSRTEDSGRESTTIYENGLVRSVTVTDGGSDYAWQSYQTVNDINGDRTSYIVNYDDGRVVTNSYGPTGLTRSDTTDGNDQFDWASINKTYNAAGDMTAMVRTDDNGVVRTNTYENNNLIGVGIDDTADAFLWDTIDQTFNTDGLMTRSVSTYDDGRVIETAYINGQRDTQTYTDADDQFNWATLHDTYDVSGARTSRTTVYDDGREVVTVYVEDFALN